MISDEYLQSSFRIYLHYFRLEGLFFQNNFGQNIQYSKNIAFYLGNQYLSFHENSHYTFIQKLMS